MENQTVLVATYGTLLTGQGNHGVMVRAGGQSKGLGRTQDNANIYDYAHRGFPAVSLTRTSAERQVRVEVFEVPAIYYKPATIDDQEDEQCLYSGFIPATKEEHSEGNAFLHVGTDGLEGYADHRGTSNTFYQRSLLPIVLDSGEIVEAYMYHIEGNEDEYEGITLITNGDWVQFKNNDWSNEDLSEEGD